MVETKAGISYNTPQDDAAFDELKQRFLKALETEKQRIKGQVERESASIIAEAELKAKRIAEETVMRAKEESKRIIDEARQESQRIAEEEIKRVESEASIITAAAMGLSEQLIAEAERFASGMSTLRLKLESEVKDAQERLREKAKVATDVTQRVDNVVEPVAAVSERAASSGSTVGGIDHYDSAKETENTGYVERLVPANMHARRKVLEQTMSTARQPNSKNTSDDKLFVGTLEFSITGGPNSAPLQGLLNHLIKTHGVEILSTNKVTDGVTKMVVMVRKPIPILKILKQMASVEDAFETDKNIQIKLAIGPTWVG